MFSIQECVCVSKQQHPVSVFFITTSAMYYPDTLCLSTHFLDTMYVKTNMLEKQREQPTAVRHSNVQQWQQQEGKDNKWKQ